MLGPAPLIGWRRHGPWTVLRAERDGDPRTVIVKWLRDQSDGVRADPSQPVTECVALRLLAGLGSDVPPRVLGADLRGSVLILEDLAPRVPLAELLSPGSDGAARATGLRELGAALGRLHAATAGHERRYHRRRARYGPVDPPAERMRFVTPWRDVAALAAALDVPIAGGVERDLAAAIGELVEPGPFLAMSNGDAEANNLLVDGGGGGGRLIDFEFAGFRHALCDVSCLYVPGPMWMAVADPSTDGSESAYRGAVAGAVPEAGDDRRYGVGIASAALACAVHRLGRLRVLDGRGPGDRSRLQMICLLDAAAAVATRFGAHPHLAGWAGRVAERLRRRWSDAGADPATIPAYTRRHPLPA